ASSTCDNSNNLIILSSDDEDIKPLPCNRIPPTIPSKFSGSNSQKSAKATIQQYLDDVKRRNAKHKIEVYFLSHLAARLLTYVYDNPSLILSRLEKNKSQRNQGHLASGLARRFSKS